MGVRKTSPDERGFERHGMTKTKEYFVWCKIPKSNICESWRMSFTAFINDIGFRPSEEHMLLRRDKSKPHGPDNTYWGIRTGQMTLNDGRVVKLTLNGKRISQTDLCRKFNINAATLRSRLTAGWSIKDAVTIPTEATIREKQKANPNNYLDKRKTHGMSNTPEYRIWARNVHSKTLCREFASDFKVFYNAVGKRPGPDYILTRKDRTQLMSPTNFVWRCVHRSSSFKPRKFTTRKARHGSSDSCSI